MFVLREAGDVSQPSEVKGHSSVAPMSRTAVTNDTQQ